MKGLLRVESVLLLVANAICMATQDMVDRRVMIMEALLMIN